MYHVLFIIEPSGLLHGGSRKKGSSILTVGLAIVCRRSTVVDILNETSQRSRFQYGRPLSGVGLRLTLLPHFWVVGFYPETGLYSFETFRWDALIDSKIILM